MHRYYEEMFWVTCKIFVKELYYFVLHHLDKYGLHFSKIVH